MVYVAPLAVFGFLTSVFYSVQSLKTYFLNSRLFLRPRNMLYSVTAVYVKFQREYCGPAWYWPHCDIVTGIVWALAGVALPSCE